MVFQFIVLQKCCIYKLSVRLSTRKNTMICFIAILTLLQWSGTICRGMPVQTCWHLWPHLEKGYQRIKPKCGWSVVHAQGTVSVPLNGILLAASLVENGFIWFRFICKHGCVLFITSLPPTCLCICFCIKGVEQNRAAIWQPRVPDVIMCWVQFVPFSLPPLQNKMVFQLCTVV